MQYLKKLTFKDTLKAFDNFQNKQQEVYEVTFFDM